MYVLFVSRLLKQFWLRKADGPDAYDPPVCETDTPSLVDDSIEGRLDAFAVIARIADEEGWRRYGVIVS